MSDDLSKADALDRLDMIDELVDLLERRGPRLGGRHLASVRSIVPVMRQTIEGDEPVRRDWLIEVGVDLALKASEPKLFGPRVEDFQE